MLPLALGIMHFMFLKYLSILQRDCIHTVSTENKDAPYVSLPFLMHYQVESMKKMMFPRLIPLSWITYIYLGSHMEI